MYDKGKILPGLLIFAALVTVPFWWNPVFGKPGVVPQPKLPADKSLKCVLEKTRMREQHMQVIYQWREEVVRSGNRTATTLDGKTLNKSLSNTCLTQCHESKKEFCDQCHQYLAVQPFCWDCHLVPKETT